MRMRNQDAWFTHKRALNFQGGSSSQATNPWGAGATAHRSLKPKKTRAWDPERDFCQDDPGNETLWPGTKGAGTAVFQAVQTSGKLKTAGHTYQKLCCSDRGTKQQQKEELNADVFLAFSSLVIYRSLIVPGRWALTTACELPLTLYTIMHLPSWTLSYGGKQLCLWHS